VKTKSLDATHLSRELKAPEYTCPKLRVFGDVQTLTNQEGLDVNQMMNQVITSPQFGLFMSFSGL
jgi:hypothetical protein